MATDVLQSHTGARRWGLPQYLAMLALPILFLESWSVISWLLDGPHQITEYRSDGKGREWWGARGFEAGVIVLSIWVISRLVRDCRRQGKILTFDVMFCIVGATLLWVNAGNSFFAPMFTISSAFVNLNDTCGHNPLIVNPDCGRFANPMIFLWSFELLGHALRAVPRLPRISDADRRLASGRLAMISMTRKDDA